MTVKDGHGDEKTMEMDDYGQEGSSVPPAALAFPRLKMQGLLH